MEKIKENIERFKLRADLFLRENTKAFIIDARDNWHFCYIEKINKDKVEIKEFSGKLTGQSNIINWIDVLKFEEFRDGGR